MAAGWSVILEGDAPVADAATGRSLLYYQRQVDDLATQLGLSPLSSFFSRDPNAIAQYLGDQGVQVDMESLPDEEWFEPRDGLATLHGLLTELRSDTTAVPEPARIVADLEIIKRALESAMHLGVRFHLGRQLPRLESE